MAQKIILPVAFLTVVSFCALFSYQIWPTLQPGDKGTWAGAFGTVATLLGTIWLATSESRHRAREEHDKTVIAACYLLPAIVRVEAKIGPVISVLVDDFRVGYGIDFTELANELEYGGQWTRDDLIPFAHLPNHPAAKLATARSQIDYCIKVMRDLSTSTATTQHHIGICRQVAPILDAARAHLAAVRVQLTPVANISV